MVIVQSLILLQNAVFFGIVLIIVVTIAAIIRRRVKYRGENKNDKLERCDAAGS